ncbi:phosphotransferase family protein [Moniliophthora roreri]|nr:phosphotransferase family protein [Moniliophthora roreri]
MVSLWEETGNVFLGIADGGGSGQKGRMGSQILIEPFSILLVPLPEYRARTTYWFLALGLAIPCYCATKDMHGILVRYAKMDVTYDDQLHIWDVGRGSTQFSCRPPMTWQRQRHSTPSSAIAILM